jgi:predicted DNA-binding transcriptional regulator AlpA
MANPKPPLVYDCDHRDDILSPAETAKQLGLSQSQLAKWRSTGKGPVFVKLGRKVGYTRWGNAAFIRANLQHRPDPV